MELLLLSADLKDAVTPDWVLVFDGHRCESALRHRSPARA